MGRANTNEREKNKEEDQLRASFEEQDRNMMESSMGTHRVAHPGVPSGAGLGKYRLKDRVKCKQYEAYASTQLSSFVRGHQTM